MDGTHCGVGDKRLPVYPDEYVFRHSRHVTPGVTRRFGPGLASVLSTSRSPSIVTPIAR